MDLEEITDVIISSGSLFFYAAVEMDSVIMADVDADARILFLKLMQTGAIAPVSYFVQSKHKIMIQKKF